MTPKRESKYLEYIDAVKNYTSNKPDLKNNARLLQAANNLPSGSEPSQALV